MSSISRAPYSGDISSEFPEESGWTTYLEDFFNNHNDDKCSSSSLVSDAGSLAAKELADEISVNKNGKRSSFKKRKKTKAAMVDDALEDTASSPVNSPKVSYANQLDKPRQNEEEDLSQEKGSSSGQRDERKELGFIGRDSDCTELKKRGLCLVPLSIVLNYLG